MNAIKSIFRLRSWEGMFNNFVSAFLIMAMMLLVVTNVAGRYVLNITVHGTLEITEFIMVAVVYFSLAHTQAIKAHIRVELLFGIISRRTKIVFELITYVFGLAVFVLMTWQTGLSFLDSWEYLEETDGYISFPIYPAKLAIPIGCLFVCLRFVADIIDAIKQLAGKDDP